MYINPTYQHSKQTNGIDHSPEKLILEQGIYFTEQRSYFTESIAQSQEQKITT